MESPDRRTVVREERWTAVVSDRLRHDRGNGATAAWERGSDLETLYLEARARCDWKRSAVL
jgi:hypothetical protein